ncbi:MAG: spondin domain-containing protein, partial [Planctomycetota bacterium]
LSASACSAAFLLTSQAALALQVEVTVTSNAPTGGVYLTPLWVGFHDGSFDNFTPGTPASEGLEVIAELGDTSVRQTEFLAAQPGAVGATLASGLGAPVFSPGESEFFDLSVGDATTNRFFSFAGMVVPTNDLFAGNGNAIELFDAAGNFNGPVTITVFGSNIWDAGTEVNDFANGPAFVVGVDATLGTEENGNVSLFFSDPNAGAYLDSILDAETPVNTIGSTFDASTPLYRITVVPEPATLGLAALGGVALLRRRK